MEEEPYNQLTVTLLHEEEASREEDVVVDWLGRPILATQLGGWSSALCITGRWVLFMQVITQKGEVFMPRRDAHYSWRAHPYIAGILLCNFLYRRHKKYSYRGGAKFSYMTQPYTERPFSAGMVFSAIPATGITSNLVVYLVDVWKQSNAKAATNYTNLEGFSFLTSLLGAFIADAYFGRLRTAWLFQIILLLGCIFVSWIVRLQQEHGGNPCNALEVLLLVSLYVMSLGIGSCRVILTTLAADQLDGAAAKSRCFSIFTALNSIAQAFCLTVPVYLENRGKWSLASWMCTAGAAIGTVILATAAPTCRQYRVEGNPILRVLQVLVAAIRKSGFQVSGRSTSMLYEFPENKSGIVGSRRLKHTERFRWLDKAATITFEDKVKGLNSALSTNQWQLCTVSEVEEVKCLGKTIPVALIATFFAVGFVQGATLFIEQAQTMDRSFDRFTIPSVSLHLFSMLSSQLCAFIFEIILVPFFRQYTGLPKGITSLQRTGCGGFMLVLTMVLAAFVERKRLEMARFHGVIDDADTPVPLSVFWLVPQIFLMGIARFCLTVGLMDYFYGELSDGMKCFGISISVLSLAVGNFISSILITVVNSITDQNGSHGWIYKNLNEGHLDYFYWLLSALMSLNFIAFLLIACKYEYRE